MAAAHRRPAPVAAILFVLTGFAILIAIVTLSVIYGSPPPRPTPQSIAPPPAPLPGPARPPRATATPPVEPLEFADMSPDQARAFNAGVPVAPGAVAPAPPFRYAGDRDDRARAIACLAAAMLYEAGDEPTGEAAVAQIVLNRVRHPAFPKTVCGVVFQGAERRTGCQFTFTCDGALGRRPNPAAWSRARALAERALAGRVVAAVGTATHYHADYVVPYWGSSLTKIAVVAPHIFYRWPGRWGQAASFVGRPLAPEPIDPRVAMLDGLVPPADLTALGAVDGPLAPLRTLSIAGVPDRALKGNIVRLKDEEGGQYILQLDPAAFPGSYAIVGFTICSGRPNCIVMGWTGAGEVPRAFPILPATLRTLAFMYRRSSILDTAAPSWDCRRFARPVASQCLPGTAR